MIFKKSSILDVWKGSDYNLACFSMLSRVKSMFRSGAIKCNLIQSNYFYFIHICNNTCHVINPEFNLFPYFKCARIFNKKMNREIRLNQGFVSPGHWIMLKDMCVVPYQISMMEL